jgi:hypothetical protein
MQEAMVDFYEEVANVRTEEQEEEEAIFGDFATPNNSLSQRPSFSVQDLLC